MRRIFGALTGLLVFAAALLLLTGCGPKVIEGPGGCNARVAAHKRAACHACVRQGPRFAYMPHRAPGTRCIRR